MAYTKQEWNCGDTITADKMNHIEEGIEAASDKGYECTESWTTLTEESVTTVAEDLEPSTTLAYTTLIDADTIKVTFNGVQYECNKRAAEGAFEYGAPSADGHDFSEYPFNIYSESGSNYFTTQTAGTYTIKIEALEESVTTTPCFEKAVKSVAKGGRLIKKVGAAACNSQYDEYDISLTAMQNLVLQGVPMMIETTSGGESVYKQILNYIFSSDQAKLIVVSDSSLALAEMTLYANNGADGYMDSGRCN